METHHLNKFVITDILLSIALNCFNILDFNFDFKWKLPRDLSVFTKYLGQENYMRF